jgi:hypothetical protein
MQELEKCSIASHIYLIPTWLCSHQSLFNWTTRKISESVQNVWVGGKFPTKCSAKQSHIGKFPMDSIFRISVKIALNQRGNKHFINNSCNWILISEVYRRGGLQHGGRKTYLVSHYLCWAPRSCISCGELKKIHYLLSILMGLFASLILTSADMFC